MMCTKCICYTINVYTKKTRAFNRLRDGAPRLLLSCRKTKPLPSGSLPTSRRWVAGRWPETASPSETRNASSSSWWRWMQRGCWLQRPCLTPGRLGWMKSLSARGTMAMSWHKLFTISSAPPDLDTLFVPFVIQCIAFTHPSANAQRKNDENSRKTTNSHQLTASCHWR